jgi:hypothetical protein
MRIDHLPNKSPKPRRETKYVSAIKTLFLRINGEGKLCSSTISYIYCYR